MNKTQQEIEALYYEYEKYIIPTIKRQFPNYDTMLSIHRLAFDDLVQYGRLGVYEACKTYNNQQGIAFKNYVINNIKWSINNGIVKDSIKKSKDDNREYINPETTAELDSYTNEIAQDDSYYYKTKDFFEELKRLKLPDNIIKIIELKVKGFTLEEIGKIVGFSSQYVHKLLKKYESTIKKVIVDL